MSFWKQACVPVALVAIAGLLFYNLTLIKEPAPSGTWVDTNDPEYFVVFSGNGTYVESNYNIPRQYSYNGSTLSYYDISGELYSTALRKNYGSKFTMTLDGKTRVLQRTTQRAKLSNWNEGLTGHPLSAYKLVNDFPDFFYIRLFDNDVYRSVFGETETLGKYTITSDQHLYLFNQSGDVVGHWEPWGDGYVSGLMQGTLTVLQEEGVPVLTGNVSLADSNMSYQFHKDGTVVLKGDEQHTFTYTVSPDGLVSMKDKAGAGEEDYLCVNLDTGKAYRYLIATDGWFEYLSNQ